MGEGYKKVPYRQRRVGWGGTTGVSYGSYIPKNYDSHLLNRTQAYGSQGLLEFHLNIKKNLNWGSFGMALGVGTYHGDGNNEEATSTLDLFPIRLGVQYTMDYLFDEPIIAPYMAGGLYTVFYKEKLKEGKVFEGNTQPSFCAIAGVLIQLDWIDAKSALEAYQESGIENTFFFLEARYFMESQNKTDPNLSTMYTSLGLKVEF